MVVLAAAVINKGGKALVSRQFVSMTRIRIEGLLAAFPKLLGSGKQHTTVEAENVRYVYQPLELLYLILVTNKQSNILEDLETLRTLAKLIPERCHSLEEDAVCKYGFEIIFTFDEVISLGHKEAVTASQIKEYLEMDSHEERMHKMMLQTKINETKDVMKKRANEIDKNKLDRLRSDKSGIMPMPIRFDNGYNEITSSGNFSSNGTFDPNGVSKARTSTATTTTAAKKGMQLGKAQRANQFIESLKAEGEVVEDSGVAAVGSMAAAASAEPVNVSVEEKLTIVVKRDGAVENFDLQGTLALVVQDRDHACIRVQVAAEDSDRFQFKTHPNIDKELYAQNILGLRDSRRSFPTGTPTGILKWRMTSKDDGLVPFTLNCWPSNSGRETYVSIEYEARQRFDLQNVIISIPLPALRDPPTMNHIDGEWRYDARKSVLQWSIVLVDDSNRSGSMEFVVPKVGDDHSVFFPIDVSFSATTTFCDIRVVSVSKVEDGEQVLFGGNRLLQVESYQVV